MPTPKVSICIPTYNQPVLLRRALASVEMQEYKDYEVIITDDSNNTLSEEVALEFKQRMPTLFYFKNQEKKGSPENWNEAVRHTKGEYIKFLHTDDCFEDPTTLTQFVEALDDHPETDFAFSASTNMSEGKKLDAHYPTPLQLKKMRKDARAMYPHNYVGAPSATIYRKSVNKTYDVRMKITVDVDFYIQVLRQNPHFVYINKSLVTTEAGAVHQQTTIYQHTREGGLLETLWEYNKINQGIWFKLRTFKYLMYAFRIFKVGSLADIQEVASTATLTTKIMFRKAILANKLLSVFKK